MTKKIRRRDKKENRDMHTSMKTPGWFIISLIACLCFPFWGCGGDAKQTEKPKVVREKIPVSKEAPAAAPIKIAQQAPEESAPKPIEETVESTPVSAPPAAAVSEPPAAPVTTPPAVEEKSEDVKSEAVPMLAVSEQNAQTGAVIAYRYDPTGKIDPFEPLFKQKEASEGVVKTVSKRKRRIPTTPLEKVDLSQLKLVATLRAASGDRALVEDASGKGYIIKKGTYIGTNAGVVLEIMKDRVIVEEEVESIPGEFSIEKRELKLQKPPGE